MIFMQNLKRAEAGSSLVRHLPSYEKQLETVKKHLFKALEKVQKWKLTDVERNSLTDIVHELDRAFMTSHLDKVIEKFLDLTRRFKDD